MTLTCASSTMTTTSKRSKGSDSLYKESLKQAALQTQSISWLWSACLAVFQLLFGWIPFVKKHTRDLKSLGYAAHTLPDPMQYTHERHTRSLLYFHSQLQPPFNPIRPSLTTTPTERSTLVLDLDETLVHSSCRLPLYHHLVLDIEVDGQPCTFFVTKRPYVDYFLYMVSQWYDVVIYTASLQKYADPLIDHLDPHANVKLRLFRDSCEKVGTNFVKNLSAINPNLSRILIIDNSPYAYSKNKENGIPIIPFFWNKHDVELLNLLPFLQCLSCMNDVRSLLSLRTQGT